MSEKTESATQRSAQCSMHNCDLILICKTHVNNQFYHLTWALQAHLLYLSLELYKSSLFIDERLNMNLLYL